MEPQGRRFLIQHIAKGDDYWRDHYHARTALSPTYQDWVVSSSTSSYRHGPQSPLMEAVDSRLEPRGPRQQWPLPFWPSRKHAKLLHLLKICGFNNWTLLQFHQYPHSSIALLSTHRTDHSQIQGLLSSLQMVQHQDLLIGFLWMQSLLTKQLPRQIKWVLQVFLAASRFSSLDHGG